SDKLKRSQLPKNISMIRKSLALEKDEILIPFSGETKDGKKELWNVIDDILSRVQYVENDEIDDDVIEFINKRMTFIKKGIPISIDIEVKNSFDEKDKEAAEAGFKKAFLLRAGTNRKIEKLNRLVSFFVLVIGIIMLSLYIILITTKLSDGFITELMSIVSCFFVWTAADIFFFQRSQYKILTFVYGRLFLADINITSKEKATL
ncbi:MAG: hypothetical protein RSD69_03385, partial [Bacilli bacterium]